MFEKLKQKPEEYRKKLALGVSSGFLIVMLSVWVYSNGFLGFSEPILAENSTKLEDKSGGTKKIASSKSNSPIENSTKTFSALWAEISDQYGALQDSLSSVLVPFITGIEVYDKTGE